MTGPLVASDAVGENKGQLVLAVTSSTGVVSMAIGLQRAAEANSADIDPAKIMAEATFANERRHAEEISPRLQQLLETASVTLADLDKLVVDRGPGRFTGRRVGLSTMRALGFALGLPVVGVSSLDILAAGMRQKSVTAVIDARRDEVFQQCYVDGSAVGEPQVGPALALAPQAIGVVVGDGVDRYHDIYQTQPHLDGIERERNPDAAVMLSMTQDDHGVDSTEVAPLYLRDPDANPNIKTRRGVRE